MLSELEKMLMNNIIELLKNKDKYFLIDNEQNKIVLGEKYNEVTSIDCIDDIDEDLYDQFLILANQSLTDTQTNDIIFTDIISGKIGITDEYKGTCYHHSIQYYCSKKLKIELNISEYDGDYNKVNINILNNKSLNVRLDKEIGYLCFGFTLNTEFSYNGCKITNSDYCKDKVKLPPFVDVYDKIKYPFQYKYASNGYLEQGILIIKDTINSKYEETFVLKRQNKQIWKEGEITFYLPDNFGWRHKFNRFNKN